MLTDGALDQVAQFATDVDALWSRIGATVPGLQMVRRRDQAVLVCSRDGFYESVVVAQLPHVHVELVGSMRNPVRREVPNERKPIEKQEIKLSGAEVDAILALWAKGRSAAAIARVMGKDGRVKKAV